MARPLEFCREEALDRALDLFWEQGYEGASMQQLLERMGICRSSFYNAFGSKHELFVAALARYEEAMVEPVLRRLEASGPVREVVRGVFEDAVRDASCGEGRRGCLLVNSAVERAPHDPRVAERVAASFHRIEEAFRERLEGARAAGDRLGGRDPGALASFLTLQLQGLRVVCKVNPRQATLRPAVELALELLA